MTAEDFWNWFSANNENYISLHDESTDKKNILIDLFLEKLHEYCEGLFFAIEPQIDNRYQLIITAEGNVDYFEKVEELISSAPRMANWSFTAFKPPIEGDFIVEYEGLQLDTQDLWFLPMQHHTQPKLFGLIVGIPNYDPEDRDRFLGAVYHLLDTLLGERTTSVDVHYLDLDALPLIPEDDGYLRISELRRYLEWHKDGLVPFNFSLN